jgi:predicted transcriptional regulator
MVQEITMTIVVTLSPELEALLLDKASQRGQDVNLVASELLATILKWEEQDSEEAIKGIQQGLDDFELGRFRSFQDFAEEQRSKPVTLRTRT